MTIAKSKAVIKSLKEKSEVDATTIAGELDSFLEQIAMDDGFGTERQTDPRGDGRDDEYASVFVENKAPQTQTERNIEVLDNLEALLVDPSEEYLRESFLETFSS